MGKPAEVYPLSPHQVGNFAHFAAANHVAGRDEAILIMS